jgi:hypothetical protein
LVTGASENASSPATLMAGGGGWLGHARKKERGVYRTRGMPRQLLGSVVAYRGYTMGARRWRRVVGPTANGGRLRARGRVCRGRVAPA